MSNTQNSTQKSITDYFQKRKSSTITNNDKRLKLDDTSVHNFHFNDEYFNEKINFAKSLIQDVFGFSCFRSDLQKQAISDTLRNRNDVLVLMPPSSGKSLIYQLPAVCETHHLKAGDKGNVTIVISPVLSLITDQLNYLKNLEINAETYNSNTESNKRTEIRNELMSNNVRISLLYITPEMALKTKIFKKIFDHLDSTRQLKRIVIDEFHLVVEWGHTFRPEYLKLGELKQRYPSVQWVLLSASASVEVINEVKSVLKLREPVSEFMAPNYRDNLYYEVVFKDLMSEPKRILSDFIKQQIYLRNTENRSLNNKKSEVGIVYCREIYTCNELANSLLSYGVNCAPFHSGIKRDQRIIIQDKWMRADIHCITATFNIISGIHNPNVRFVVHWNVPFSLSSYYQQSGRAGRDGRPARCRIYYSSKDRNTNYSLLDNNYKKQRFNDMIEYCESGGGCRHKMLMDFITDDRLRNGCKNVCDLCLNPDLFNRALKNYKQRILY